MGSTPRYLGRSGPYHVPGLAPDVAFLVAFFACFTVRRIVVMLCGPTGGEGRQERRYWFWITLQIYKDHKAGVCMPNASSATRCKLLHCTHRTE